MATYKAWDGEDYEEPTPEGWYLASDGRWWPEGYGPPVKAVPAVPSMPSIENATDPAKVAEAAAKKVATPESGAQTVPVTDVKPDISAAPAVPEKLKAPSASTQDQGEHVWKGGQVAGPMSGAAESGPPIEKEEDSLDDLLLELGNAGKFGPKETENVATNFDSASVNPPPAVDFSLDTNNPVPEAKPGVDAAANLADNLGLEAKPGIDAAAGLADSLGVEAKSGLDVKPDLGGLSLDKKPDVEASTQIAPAAVAADKPNLGVFDAVKPADAKQPQNGDDPQVNNNGTTEPEFSAGSTAKLNPPVSATPPGLVPNGQDQNILKPAAPNVDPVGAVPATPEPVAPYSIGNASTPGLETGQFSSVSGLSTPPNSAPSSPAAPTDHSLPSSTQELATNAQQQAATEAQNFNTVNLAAADSGLPQKPAGFGGPGISETSPVTASSGWPTPAEDSANQNGRPESGRPSGRPGGQRKAPPADDGFNWLAILAVVATVLVFCILAYLFLTRSGSSAAGSFETPYDLRPQDKSQSVRVANMASDKVWLVQVVELATDATEARVTAGSAAAEDGNVYIATEVAVSNSYAASATPNELTFALVTKDGTSYSLAENACPAVAGDFELATPVAQGTAVQGAVCWNVPLQDQSDLLIAVGYSGETSEPTHLTLN